MRSEDKVRTFLRESNAIEDVYDDMSSKDAFLAWRFISQFETINTQIVKHTHKILMKHQDIEPKYKGMWRDHAVYINNQKKDLPPIVLDQQVSDLCKQMMSKKKQNPIELHVVFENIHPFIDGNGRIGRIIMNWHSLIKNDDDIIIFTREERDTYYKLFQKDRQRMIIEAYGIQQDIMNA